MLELLCLITFLLVVILDKLKFTFHFFMVIKSVNPIFKNYCQGIEQLALN